MDHQRVPTNRVLWLSLGMTVLLIGCNTRVLTVSVTDRVYVPPAMPQAEGSRELASAPGTADTARAPRLEPTPAPPLSGPGVRSEQEIPPIPSPPGGPPAKEIYVAEGPLTPPPVGPREPIPSSIAPPAAPGAAPTPPRPTEMKLADAFFDYDRWAIRADARSVLAADGAALRDMQSGHILIEGYCDERGTSGYNLVLGERRARAAKQYLQDLGIAVSRIQTMSFGKERPFCLEHTVDCWQQNRRAHLVMQ